MRHPDFGHGQPRRRSTTREGSSRSEFKDVRSDNEPG
jgi:hypothetical protein